MKVGLRIISVAALALLGVTLSIATPMEAQSARETRVHRLDRNNVHRQRFGQLRLLGALRWNLPRDDFGGFSGLHVAPDGTLTALTDKAHWFRARLIEREDGRLEGLAFEDVGRLKDPRGVQLERPFMDSEALARTPQQSWLIAFEGRHRVSEFASLRSAAAPVDLAGARVSNLPINKGIEALSVDAQGRIVMIGEGGRRTSPAWIVDHGSSAAFKIARSRGFRVTDLAFDRASESFFVLERRFSYLGGLATRLRRFAASDIREGAIIKPKTLFESDATTRFDNMEGLALLRSDTGKLYIYMISDDNFSSIQRTLVIKFELINE